MGYTALVDDASDRVNLRWLLGLRWAGYLAMSLAAVVAANVLHLDLPLAPIAIAIGVGVLSNLAAHAWLARGSRGFSWGIFGALALDVALLTLALQVSGGPANPFVLSYLLPLVVAAVTLRQRLTLLLLALCASCAVGVLMFHQPLRADHEHAPVLTAEQHHHHLDAAPSDAALEPGLHLQQHLHGVSLALVVLGALIIYLVRWALGRRDAELRALRAEQERNERLIELSTLAASAAHELGTPLSTIAVVAAELDRKLELGITPDGMVEDVRVIREQIGRCRKVLSDLGNDARAGGEQPTPLVLGELLEEVRRTSSEPERVKIEVRPGAARSRLELPRRALLGVVSALVENGLQASGAEPVLLGARASEGWRIEVVDRGPGLDSGVLGRLGSEPVHSASGMGIGLFLGRAVLERLGGTLTFEGERSLTRAVLCLPASPARAGLDPERLEPGAPLGGPREVRA